jgi:hypothetical protein
LEMVSVHEWDLSSVMALVGQSWEMASGSPSAKAWVMTLESPLARRLVLWWDISWDKELATASGF